MLRDSQSWVGGLGEGGRPGGHTFSWAEQCRGLSSARRPASGLPWNLAGAGDRPHVPTHLQGGRESSAHQRGRGTGRIWVVWSPPSTLKPTAAELRPEPPPSPRHQQAAPRPQACPFKPGQMAAPKPGELAEEIQPLGHRKPGTPQVRHRCRSATPRVSARCTACLQQGRRREWDPASHPHLTPSPGGPSGTHTWQCSPRPPGR